MRPYVIKSNGEIVDFFEFNPGEGYLDFSSIYSAGGNGSYSSMITTSGSQDDIALAIYTSLINRGFSKACACGVIGNAFGESSLNPDIYAQDSGGWDSYGLFMMYGGYSGESSQIASGLPGKYKVGSQPDYLYRYAGSNWNSVEKQIEFIFDITDSSVNPYNFKQLLGERNSLSVKIASDFGYSLPNSVDEFKSTQDVRQATVWFCAIYEKPGIPHMDNRISGAQNYYNKFTTKPVDQYTQNSTSLEDFRQYYGKISNCGSDENGNDRGGLSGDQTGYEWWIKNWNSRPWYCVLRYPDRKVTDMIAQLAIEAAKNDNIGYDFGNRYSYWTELEKVGYRPSRITTQCEADCSAGVCANVKAVGYLLNLENLKGLGIITTHTMRDTFQSIGFQVLTDSKYLTGFDYLIPGDILLNDALHTATNLGIGAYVN